MPEQKPKRILKDIKFNSKDSHIALTSEVQGYSANNRPDALILKAVGGLKTQAVETSLKKIQQIQVTLELPEFLRRFFDLYYDDAEVLAKLLGYEHKPEDNYYNEYLEEKVESFTILKSLHESANPKEAFEKLEPNSKLAVLVDQILLEKQLLDNSNTKINQSVEDTQVPEGKNEPTAKPAEAQETEALAKSLSDVQGQLSKATAELEEFRKEKEQAVLKSKTEKIVAACKDKTHVEIFTKAALALKDEKDFNEFVAGLETLNKAVEESSIFREVGKDGKKAETDNSLLTLIQKKFKQDK